MSTTLPPPLSSHARMTPAVGLTASLREPQTTGGFGELLKSAQEKLDAPVQKERVEVRPGDTLIGLAKRQAAQAGVFLTERQAMQQALQTAKSNGIANPNLIFPGQTVELTTLPAGQDTRLSSSPGLSTQERLLARQSPGSHPVLQKTLERAVEKGYMSRSEQPLVYDRILRLAEDFNFDPDDFAHVAMMESDGLNPKATNGRCHGIIQFCEGPGRGAASVDRLGQAASIRNMSVLDQLNLVERYFRDVGLETGSPRKVQLDDLYLSILTPAARSYREPNQSLPIPGVQAAALHIDGQRHRPITRASIVSGLIQNSQNRLGERLEIDPRRQVGLLQVPTNPERNLTGVPPAAATQRQDLAAQTTPSTANRTDSPQTDRPKARI